MSLLQTVIQWTDAPAGLGQNNDGLIQFLRKAQEDDDIFVVALEG